MKPFSTLLSLVGICLLVLLLVPSQAHAQAYTNATLVQQASSYSVLGTPTVSAAFMNQVLAANHSPAAGVGPRGAAVRLGKEGPFQRRPEPLPLAHAHSYP